MKKISKKKNKPKNKWQKQCGDFVFKNVFYSANGNCLVDVYFKEELIGVMYCIKHLGIKSSYTFDIYDSSDLKPHKKAGIVHCLGMSHGLPKQITYVSLGAFNSILNLERNVIIEKYSNE